MNEGGAQPRVRVGEEGRGGFSPRKAREIKGLGRG